jgi:hypothetical protein
MLTPFWRYLKLAASAAMTMTTIKLQTKILREHREKENNQKYEKKQEEMVPGKISSSMNLINLRLKWNLIYEIKTNHKIYTQHNKSGMSALLITSRQGQIETCGCPRQANNLVHLQTDILKEFVQHVFSRCGEKLIFY